MTAEPPVPKGRGRERTFQRDLTDPVEIRREVARLAREMHEDVLVEGRPVARVVVKVRFTPFTTVTHGAAVSPPTLEDAELERAALAALERFELDRPVRLLGVRAEMTPL